MIFYFRSRSPCYISRYSNGLYSRQIFARELTNLPQFLRFDQVKFNYRALNAGYAIGNAPIEKKCQSVVNYLQRLKLNDSNLIHIIGAINKNNRRHFINYTQLFDHLRNEFLPICGSSRRYKFEIYCLSDEVSHTNLIAQILQLPQISCCSNVEINFPIVAMQPLQFPIESISNWLNRICNESEEKPKERFLRIFHFNFLCGRELCDHLKKVTFVIF